LRQVRFSYPLVRIYVNGPWPPTTDPTLTLSFRRRDLSAIILTCASIPTACTGLVNDPISLTILRLCIGMAGGTFVMCQYWTSRMFTKSVVGTANALVGGWGNLGGGTSRNTIHTPRSSSLTFVSFVLPYLRCYPARYGIGTLPSLQVLLRWRRRKGVAYGLRRPFGRRRSLRYVYHVQFGRFPEGQLLGTQEEWRHAKRVGCGIISSRSTQFQHMAFVRPICVLLWC